MCNEVKSLKYLSSKAQTRDKYRNWRVHILKLIHINHIHISPVQSSLKIGWDKKKEEHYI